MNRILYCFVGLALLLTACAKSEPMEPQEALDAMASEEAVSPELVRNLVPMTFEADSNADQEGDAAADQPGAEGTKNFVDGSQISWTVDRTVAIYDNLSPTKHIYTVTVNSSNKRYATLNGTVTEGSTRFFATYPSSVVASFTDGECQVAMPSVQRAGAYYVDQSALVSVASASNMVMSFRNVFALLSFTVNKDDITHIQLIGNQGSVLAGTVTVDPSTGNITAVKDPKTEIHFYPQSTYFETGKTYYLPILPYVSGVTGSLKGDCLFNGFTLIMYTGSETTQNTACYVKRTDKTLTLTRGKGQKLGCITQGTGYAPSTLAASRNVGYYSNKLDFAFPGGHSHPYRAALYSNAACTDMVVAFNIPSSATNSSGSENTNPFYLAESRITIGGLKPNTSYWFRGIDRTTGQPTQIAPISGNGGKTLACEIITMASSAQAGEVILREDFSELCFGASMDADGKGGAYRSDFTDRLDALVPFSGEVSEDAAKYYKAHCEPRMFASWCNALPSTRLADWAEYSERQGDATSCIGINVPVCARNGMLKIGAERYAGGIVTPPVTCIPPGKKATITVSVHGRAYADSDTEKYIAVESVDGTVKTLTGSGTYAKDDRYFMVSRTRDSQRGTVYKGNYASTDIDLTVYPGNRILIRGDRSVTGSTPGSDQQRFYTDKITLTLKSFSDDRSSGSLTFSHISFQSARVNFATSSGHIYQVYIDGKTTDPDDKTIETITGTGSTMYKSLTNLFFGTTYEVRVRDTTAGTDVGTGYVTTARVWQNTNSTGQRFVSIGWDQLYRTELGGSRQAYELQFWKDGKKILVLNPIQPGQGNTASTLFGNFQILGKGYEKDGTTHVDFGDVQGGTLYCEYYVMPTGVSIGGLQPNTAYNIRVRPLSSASYDRYLAKGVVKDNVTVTHTLGPSFKGKSPNTFKVTTDAAHIAAANELLWCGFEDFCIQRDFSNRTPGSVPYSFSRNLEKEEAPLDLTALTTLFGGNEAAVTNPYCFYPHNTSGHQTNTWNLSYWSTNVDGVACLKGYTKGQSTTAPTLNNAVVGDFGGWFCTNTCKPCMGQLLLVSNDSNAFVSSPALTDSFLGAKKLSATGTACTLSFHAVQTVYLNTAASYNLKVYVWRATSRAWELITTIAASRLQPWGERGVSDYDYYKNDYSKRPSKRFEVPMTLYPGDAVRLENDGRDTSLGIIVDDILLVRND